VKQRVSATRHNILSFNYRQFIKYGGQACKRKAFTVPKMDAPSSTLIVWKADTSPEQYERARVGRVFNHRRPERYPVAVVEAREEAHVVEAVKLAQKNGARVSIRSGGHSWAAWSVRDDAVLIDLGNLKHIKLDESTGIVSVSPSTTGRMLNDMLREKGLLFPGGHCPDVGLGGFLLQGGMGWVCKVNPFCSILPC